MPGGNFRTLFDALQLHACGHTVPAGAPDSWAPPNATGQGPAPRDAATFVVDATEPSVTRAGAPDPAAPLHRRAGGSGGLGGSTKAAPVASYPTIAAALAAARQVKPSTRPRLVLLRGGVHYLTTTLQLTAADSFTTIANYNGEAARHTAV